ncbi:hypothetical protein [Chitinophaga nivalis]|uniref:DUF4397 domain-containing protein n=1 Tax=Chitinophaga nivalis TaxID=2991709 RepID=A0ABT3IT97_9BACT|nr:hypothetical protein [Chitinophaga nivalis]MCW3463112.1 hypothetical protein [Chitinophaga nivalis]MCW3487198.1 hypothetical protein [Chitinophaga nivalis]
MRPLYVAIQPILAVAFCILVLGACKKTTDAPALPENRILEFAVTNVQDGPLLGAVNDKNATITLYVPYYSGLLSLLPEIKVPAGATVTPASNTLVENWPLKAAMDSAITYTVRAKDGSSYTYQLIINGQQPDIQANEFSEKSDAPVVLTHYPKQENVVVTIQGDNLIPNAKVTFVTLVNEAGKGYPLTTLTNAPLGFTTFSGAIPPDPAALPSGKYSIRVTSFSKTVKLKNPVIIQQITR